MMIITGCGGGGGGGGIASAIIAPPVQPTAMNDKWDKLPKSSAWFTAPPNACTFIAKFDSTETLDAYRGIYPELTFMPSETKLEYLVVNKNNETFTFGEQISIEGNVGWNIDGESIGIERSM